MFIATANTLDTISPPLLDRCEVIECSGYVTDEKLAIAKRFLLPKQVKENGLSDEGVDMADEALLRVIMDYTQEVSWSSVAAILLISAGRCKVARKRDRQTLPDQGSRVFLIQGQARLKELQSFRVCRGCRTDTWHCEVRARGTRRDTSSGRRDVSLMLFLLCLLIC